MPSASVHSSDSASGITDGPYSVAAVAVESGDTRAREIGVDENIASSEGIVGTIFSERLAKNGGDIKKKKNKPSARKAANLSGYY